MSVSINSPWCLVHVQAATYSALHVDVAVIVCLLDIHKIAAPPKICTFPVIEHLSFRFDAKLESV